MGGRSQRGGGSCSGVVSWLCPLKRADGGSTESRGAVMHWRLKNSSEVQVAAWISMFSERNKRFEQVVKLYEFILEGNKSVRGSFYCTWSAGWFTLCGEDEEKRWSPAGQLEPPLHSASRVLVVTGCDCRSSHSAPVLMQSFLLIKPGDLWMCTVQNQTHDLNLSASHNQDFLRGENKEVHLCLCQIISCCRSDLKIWLTGNSRLTQIEGVT